MKAYLAAVALGIGALAAVPAHGALLINEVLFNEVSSDTTGEWIEIFNSGSTAIDLTNYKIGDEETMGGTGATEAIHQFPAGASIAPGEVQVVAASAARFFEVYGFLPTYEAGSTDGSVPDMLGYTPWDPDGGTFNMGNSGDQALILDGTDTIVDAVSWGSSTFAFDPALGTAADGQSYERISAFVDTDTAADWQAVADTSVPAAQRSTPGVANVPEPASLGLGLAGLALVARRRNRR